MQVWKETEIQEMLFNQYFLDFPMYIVYTAFYAKVVEKRFSTIGCYCLISPQYFLKQQSLRKQSFYLKTIA